MDLAKRVGRRLFRKDDAGLARDEMCWMHQTKRGSCGLCSIFLQQSVIVELFAEQLYPLGGFQDLLAWAKKGCPLSIYIRDSFFEDWGEMPLDSELTLRWDMDTETAQGAPYCNIKRFHFQASFVLPHMRTREVNMFCWAHKDDVMALYVNNRPIHSPVDSPKSFDQAKKWISTCIRDHEKCPNQRKKTPSPLDKLPGRILDVSPENMNGDRIRLHETRRDELTQYIALSYVWGKDQQYKTTNATLAAHKRSISIEKLPKTIQDAIYCTRQLGIKYLWVDALCIVQDSLLDKEAELTKMASIYKNATVTISAAKAAGCNDGFLGWRERLESLLLYSFLLPMSLPVISATTGEEEEKRGLMCLVRRTGKHDKLLGMSEEPISQRAWTYQESWLSPRVLIYGSGSLRWRCVTMEDVDGGVLELNRDLNTPSQGHLFEDDFEVKTESDQMSHTHLWEYIVNSYTKRKLSYSSDKLIALDGVAREYGRQSRDTYLAGLWQKDVANGLCWYQCAAYCEKDTISLSKSRDCPSWSWAKVDGGVTFARAENSKVTVGKCEVSFTSPTGSPRLEVKGSISLKAPIVGFSSSDVHKDFAIWLGREDPPLVTNLIFPDGGSSNPDFHPNGSAADPETSPQIFWFLELTNGVTGGRQWSCPESHGLVLVLDREEKFYRRTGFYSVPLFWMPDLVNDGRRRIFLLTSEPDAEIQPSPLGQMFAKNLAMGNVTMV